MVCDLLTKFLKDCYLPCKEALQNHIDSEDIVTKQKGKGGGGESSKKLKTRTAKTLVTKIKTAERLKIALKI